MKVTVKNNFLNVRVGKPSVNAPCFQFLAPGSEIVVDGKLHKGDLFRGIDIWLRDEANNFYWSGGVSGDFKIESIPDISAQPIADKIVFNWFNKMGIPTIWDEFGEKGDLAKIAVLDTGFIKSNNDVSDAITGTNIIIDAVSYPGVNLVIDDTSNQGHGTGCAALLASRNNAKWITGIAPSCKLLVGKISINREIRNFDFILSGIEWAIKQGADLVSISYAVELDANEVTAFNNKFEQLLQGKNIIVVASSGNSDGTPVNGERYPASFPGCVSIGATDNNDAIAGLTIRSPRTILHAPGIDIETYGVNPIPEPQSGTSYSTPIAAAIIALAISHLRRNNKPIDRNALLQKVIDTATPIDGNPMKKIINANALFGTL